MNVTISDIQVMRLRSSCRCSSGALGRLSAYLMLGSLGGVKDKNGLDVL